MKDVRIDGRLTRVFVLHENESRMIYIPLKILHRVDYDRLVRIEKEAKDNMLERMSEIKLDNGRNALTQYDNLIQVMNKTSVVGGKAGGIRVRKPGEPEAMVTAPKVATEQAQSPTEQGVSGEIPEKPARRKPGPKPKAKQE